MVPRVVANRYRLGEVLSEDRNTTVYQAVDLHLRRSVVLKLLNPEQAPDVELVQQFLDNARAAAALAHPNVVATYDVDTENGVPYAVSEHVEGETLGNLIRSNAPLRPDRIRRLGAQIAAALDYAQRHDGVDYTVGSRDVIISSGDRVKVLGFQSGMDEDRESVGDESARETAFGYGRSAGGGHRVPTDGVRSVGVLLYQMATGRSPYEEDHDTPFSGRQAGHVVRPSLHNPFLPEVLERVILGALGTGTDRRYRSVSDLSLALQVQDAYDNEQTVAEPTTPRRTYEAPAVDPERYRSSTSPAAVLIPTLLLAAAILGAIAAGTVFRPRLDVPDVAGFISGPDPQKEKEQRTAQSASAELDGKIGAVRGNTQRIGTALSGVREKLAAEMSLVEGMRGLVEEMRRDGSGAPSSTLLATLAAKKQSVELSYASFESARAAFDSAARDLESRLGPLGEEMAQAQEASEQLQAILDDSSTQPKVQPAPGDEKAPIAEFNSAVENARREIGSMRLKDAELAGTASTLREQAAALAALRPAPQATSTAQATPAPGVNPTPGARATAEPSATPQRTATPRPSNTAEPRPTNTAEPRPTNTAEPRPTAAGPTPTPSRPLERPTAPPPPPSSGRFAIATRFVPLASQIPAQVGQATENERTDPATGDILQATTGGMLIWRRATNLFYFTDGFATWVIGPNGLEYRHNDELLEWEKALQPGG